LGGIGGGIGAALAIWLFPKYGWTFLLILIVAGVIIITLITWFFFELRPEEEKGTKSSDSEDGVERTG
jgi:uncharacterized membrane protein YdcZ (DUF606 family)